MKKNAEVRLLMKILAIIGFAIMILLLAGYVFIRIKAPQLLQFSKGIAETRIAVKLDSLAEAKFVTGMNGCENLALPANESGFFVSCLDGNIHFVDRKPAGDFVIRKTFHAGSQAIGLTLDREAYLLAVVNQHTPEEWKTRGAAISRMNQAFEDIKPVSPDFPSMNGIAVDLQGNIYFASSNFNFFNPVGAIYRIELMDDGTYGQPKEFVAGVGMANGLYFDARRNELYYSNTMNGVYRLSLPSGKPEEVYLKLRFMEACDDLCTDISGNIWMTDPGHSTVKMYNPGTNRLVRFVIEGIGQTSSCRIRSENGREMLYITELKKSQQPFSANFDGRGVLVIPAQSLLKLLEPILIR